MRASGSFVHCIAGAVDLWLDYPFSIFKMLLYIVDMTADITVLPPNCNGKLRGLFRATGNDCGGASVDDRFC